MLSGVDNTRVSVTVSAFVNTLTDFKSGGGGERALLLVIACLCVFGLFNSVLYTGYGLAALPVNLFRGFRKLEDEQLMIEYDRLKLRQNRTALQNKYETSNKHSQLKILRQLKKLEHKELIMVRHLNALEEKNNECSYRFYRLLYPFRASVGGCMFALTLLLLLSMFVNCVDRLMHSPCGFSCGYLLNSSQWFNPFDVLLVRSSSYFPIDYLALAAVGMYWFMATMYGVLRLGIRVFGCFQIFKIRHRRTSPQAMLLCALITSVAVLALTTQLGALAPQYTSFGPQRYAPSPADLADSIKHTTHAHPNSGFSISSGASAAGAVGGDNTLPCALTASRGNGRCAMTQISIFLHRITISLPVFSIAFYLLNWLFIAFTSLCIIQQVYREADTRFASVIDEDCSEDELERELMHLKENYAARSTRSNSIRASSSNHGSDTSNMYNRSTKQGQSCVPDDLRRKYITTRGNDNSNSNDSGGSSSESDGNSTSNSLTARGNQRFAKYKDELETIDEFDSANIEVDRDNGLYNDGLDGDVDGLYDDDDMGLANAGGMSRSDMDAIWAKYGRFRNTSADGEQNV